MNLTYLSPLANHLWQSTLFAAAAGLLTLALGRNHARVRHGVWLAASCKFLIPCSLLIALGSHVQWRFAPEAAQSSLIVAMDQVSEPFTDPALALYGAPAAPHAGSPLPAILLGIWLCGFLGITCSWWLRWRRLRGSVRNGSPLDLQLPIRARSSSSLLEPGVFGVFDPVLLLPEGIFHRLTPEQLEAVIAHELCHVRHRDNLIASVHMFVETAFWFHPVVWWIGKQMVEERERACDEEVLRLGSAPRVYAEGILNVCKLYVESPLVCVAGVTGANLKRRIEAIMTNRVTLGMNRAKKLLIATAGIAALAGPVAVGILGALPSRGQTQAETTPPAFEAASVKPHVDTGKRDRTRSIEPGRITVVDAPLGEFISFAYDVKRYQISAPDWIVSNNTSDTYDVVATAGKAVSVPELKRMLQRLLAERFHVVFHRETRELPVFTLVLAKSGPKFKEPGDGGEYAVRPDDEGGLSFKNVSMAGFADWLTGLPSMGRPVLDRTGLAGSFSLNANLFGLAKGADPGELKRTMVGSDAADTLRATLPEQLGLKLDPQKAPIEILVIDHADKVPTQN
jgi:uncharacterized protein (TIGR03435 family)